MGATIAYCVHCTKLWKEAPSLADARQVVLDHYATFHPAVDPPVYEEKVPLEATFKPVTIADVVHVAFEQLALWAEAA